MGFLLPLRGRRWLGFLPPLRGRRWLGFLLPLRGRRWLGFLLPLRKRRWKWRAVLVRGPSMAPTLRHGDAVLVRHGGRPVRPGDIVVARFHGRPELLVIKRAVRRETAGWWLEGDSPVVADDSRAYGLARVEGRVVLRYWPRPRWL